MNSSIAPVSDSESVARILSKEWFSDEKLMHLAFALRQGETYISVNRPSIDTFAEDVSCFVNTHADFAYGDDELFAKAAILKVDDVRSIKVELGESTAEIDVEVEPCGSRIKSHAGIFTRCNNRNLKVGDIVSVLQQDVPADDILLKVRLCLLRLSIVETIRV